MSKILAPNKSYTGVSASVSFVNGVGETDKPELINWFKEHSYTVEDEKQENDQGEGDAGHKELEDMTKAELEKMADTYFIAHNSKTTKEELIKLINEALETDGQKVEGE